MEYTATSRTQRKNVICVAFPFPFDSSLGQLLSLDSSKNSLQVYKTNLEEYYESTKF